MLLRGRGTARVRRCASVFSTISSRLLIAGLVLAGACLVGLPTVGAQSSYEQLIREGRNLLQAGKTGDALRIARQAAALEEGKYPAYVLAADIAEARGDRAVAAQFLQLALERAPAAERGVIYQRLRSIDPASLRRIVQDRVAMARQAEGRGDLRGAADTYYEAWQLDPQEPGVGFSAAAAAEATKDRVRVAQILEVLSRSIDHAVAGRASQFLAKARSEAQRETAGTVFRDCDLCPEMVLIPAGSFIMGSPASEPGRDSDEGPQHQVTIARAFAVGKYEVTRAQFARFVQEAGQGAGTGCFVWNGKGWDHDASKDWRNPGFAQTDNDPVTCVSWNDAKAYVEWLSRRAGKNYRLLTEAQWEYAARAGTSTAFAFGAAITPQQANYNTSVSYAGSPVATSRSQTVAVGSYSANAFGVHDMHGNVWEWTEDCYNGSYAGAPSDGSAWTSGDCGRRVLRGGSWLNNPRYLRSANRVGLNPVNRSGYVGLRVARTD